MDMTRGHHYVGSPARCNRCGDPWPDTFLPARECPGRPDAASTKGGA